MGIASNVIILMLIMSYALYAGTPSHESSLFFSLMGVNDDYIETYPNGTIVTYESKVKDIYLGIAALVSLVTIGGVAATIFGKSEPTYALFGGIVLLLLTFFTLPIDVFTSAVLPLEIKALIGAVYGVLMLLAVADFYRGTGGLA